MSDPIVAAGRQALEIESRAVAHAATQLGAPFRTAVELIRNATGRTVVTGIGKSGHVGRKIAATLASTGTPALFVHATEALHGDAGMVLADDVVIAISNSGETEEVCQFGALLRARGVPVIAMTGRPESRLGRLATAILDIGVEREADPLNLAPTASTTVTIGLGDALAAALMALRQFTDADFHARHPAGALGRRSGEQPGARNERRGRARPDNQVATPSEPPPPSGDVRTSPGTF